MPTVQTDDIETYYERHGEGPAIVCVHGAWMDHRMWQPQIEALSDSYEVIVYDVRGHGRTRSTAERRYTIDLFAADLEALVETLDLDRPSICGLSLGGMIAQTFAARSDRDIGALVLADTAASSALTLRDKLTQAFIPSWSMTASVRLLGPERYVDLAFWLVKRLRSADWFGRDEHVREYVRETMAAFDTAEYNRVYRAIYGFRRVDLASIRAPTLVLNGEYESRSVFEHAAHMERVIPDVRSAIVPDAGHVSNMENPEAFNRELDEFLAGA